MRLSSRIGSVAAASGAQSLMALALSVTLARLLGPAGRGAYALATFTALLAAAFGTFGFDSGNTFAASRRRQSAPELLTASLAIAFGSGSVLVLAINGLGARWGTQLLPGLPQGWLLTASLAIPFLILSALVQGILTGLGLLPRVSWLNALGVAYALILALAAGAFARDRPLSFVMAFSLSALTLACVFSLVALRATAFQLRDPMAALGGIAVFSLTSHVANCLHLLHLRLDVFLVNLFLSPREVGLYALAQAVCEWVWLVPRAAAATLMPMVAGADSGAGLSYTVRTSRMTLFVCSLPVVALGASAGLLIPALFGHAFEESAGALRILLPGIWIASITGVLSAFLTGRGQPRYPMIGSLLSLLANVALNLLLIPHLGMEGAAVASSITYTLNAALNVYFAWRLAGVTPADLLLLKREDFLGLARSLGWGPRNLP